jgi:hypothetical protein
MLMSVDLTPEAEAAGTFVNSNDTSSLNTQLVASSVRTAFLIASQDLRRAKAEGYRRSIADIEALQATPQAYKAWFEEDGGSLRPRPFEAVVDAIGATEWIKQVRRDSTTSPMTVADAHATLLPGLLALEDDRRMLSEQRREMADNEREFWRRVELIRKGQAGTISGTKRSYKDAGQLGTTLMDASNEKIALKFVQ